MYTKSCEMQIGCGLGLWISAQLSLVRLLISHSFVNCGPPSMQVKRHQEEHW